MDIIKLTETYGGEFEKEVLPELPDSQYGNLESLILYSTIRERKPRVVAELGTEMNGRSTHIIQRALIKNERPFTHVMFDMPNKTEEALANLVRKKINEGVWVLSGPIEYTSQVLTSTIGWNEVDFTFIDADHSYNFARWYHENIINFVKLGSLVHIHDINTTEDLARPTTDGSEEKYLREQKALGKLPLRTLISLDNVSKLAKHFDTWEAIREKYPFIGGPYPLEFPFINSAEYFEKI